MANNLRVVFDNAADRALTLTATNTAATLPVTNLLTDYKSEVWRSTAASVPIITLTWGQSELVSCFILAFSNLSPSATFLVRCYTESTDGTAFYTAPLKTVVPGAPLGDVAWGAGPLGVNAFSYGGGVYAAIWFPPQSVKKVSVVITDSSNPAGYIEAARVIVGNYWSPAYTAEAGASLGVIDTSKNERTDAGDLRSDRGTIHKTLNLDLNYLTNTDRNFFLGLMRSGTYKPMYLSLLPDSTDDQQGEQAYSVYGKMSRSTSLKYQLLNQFSTSLEIEEV